MMRAKNSRMKAKTASSFIALSAFIAPQIPLGRAHAFVPSSLMLGLTTHLTTDIASAPLLWILPLAIYLLSFILVFGRWPHKIHAMTVRFLPRTMTVLLIFMLGEAFIVSMQLTLYLIALNVLVFFVAALVCHGELARDQGPDPKHLTEFYVWMSVGVHWRHLQRAAGYAGALFSHRRRIQSGARAGHAADAGGALGRLGNWRRSATDESNFEDEARRSVLMRAIFG